MLFHVALGPQWPFFLTNLVNLTIFYVQVILMKTIPLTKAKARLSGLVDRLVLQKEQIVITKHGRPVAAMVPYEDWERHMAGGRVGLAAVAPPAENLDAEIDAMVEGIYLAREKSKARKPVV